MLTQSELKEHLHYNPETGIFTRIRSISNCVKVGDIAGSVRLDGYLETSVKGAGYMNHRLAWLCVHGRFPKHQIDHVNHNRSDNRIINLREATNQENHRNRPMQKNNTSGVVGVHRCKTHKKWLAYIKIDGKFINLGYSDDKFEAICARMSANNKYGFHGNHGR